MSRLIDADALVAKCGNWYCEEGTEEGFIGDIKHLMDAQPTIASECKRGRWIEARDEDPYYYICSECGHGHDFEDPFCPGCGAEMMEDE